MTLRRNFLCCRLPLSDGKGLVGIGRRPSPFFSSSLFYPVSSHFLFAPASSRKPVHRLQTPGRLRTISFAWKSVEKNVSESIPRACTLMMARFRCVLFHVSPHGVSSKRGTPTSQRMANLQKNTGHWEIEPNLVNRPTQPSNFVPRAHVILVLNLGSGNEIN